MTKVNRLFLNPLQLVRSANDAPQQRRQPVMNQHVPTVVDEIQIEPEIITIGSTSSDPSERDSDIEVIDSEDDITSIAHSQIIDSYTFIDEIEPPSSQHEPIHIETEIPQSQIVIETDDDSNTFSNNPISIEYQPDLVHSIDLPSEIDYPAQGAVENIDSADSSQFFEQKFLVMEFLSDATDTLDSFDFGYSRILVSRVVDSQFDGIDKDFEFWVISQNTQTKRLLEGSHYIIYEPFHVFPYDEHLCMIAPTCLVSE